MNYDDQLKALSEDYPRLAAVLQRAHQNRGERLHRYRRGLRLAGLEELMDHLQQLEEVFQKSRKLRRLAFLISRLHGDFCTAIEAGLSGYFAVAMDAMRDVMEIEFLLREFYWESGAIDEWLQADERELWRKFRPAVLRQKHANRLGVRVDQLSESIDYKGHSRFLHVTPMPSMFGGPGLTAPWMPFGDDACFWEMYEHGRRILFAVHHLRRKLARHVRSPWGPWRGLRAFRRGWRATQEMQAIAKAFVEVALEG